MSRGRDPLQGRRRGARVLVPRFCGREGRTRDFAVCWRRREAHRFALHTREGSRSRAQVRSWPHRRWEHDSGGSRGRRDGWGAGETLWVSLGFTKGAEQGSQMRSARGKQLLRPQWLCAPAWLRVGAGSTFGARGFEGQPLGEGPRARLRVGLGVRQREFPQTDASFLCGIICEGL